MFTTSRHRADLFLLFLPSEVETGGDCGLTERRDIKACVLIEKMRRFPKNREQDQLAREEQESEKLVS